MKRKLYGIASIWMLVLVGSVNSVAQEFTSGSNGSFGAINIETGELVLDLPPDGVIHATTINLAPNTVLRFNRNPLNTPVHLLAQGDVLIEGTINVSGTSGTSTPPVGGKGGPGGFDGGTPGILEVPPGDGHGPGGGKGGTNEGAHVPASAGSGSYATRPSNDTPNDGETYGSSLLVPLAGGSGGGGTTGQPGIGGGGGGGAILISSSTRITISQTGAVVSQGGLQNGNPIHAPNSGSGGGIRLLAPIVEGNGTLDVRGGLNNVNGTGGAGRIRIDTISRDGILFNFQPNTVVSIGSFLTSFPLVAQHLDIVNVAGRDIEVGTPNAVQIFLPFGSSRNQSVTVMARGFTGQVPIQVAVVPDSGSTIIYDATINTTVIPGIPDGTSNTIQIGENVGAIINVELPINTLTSIYAWTK